MHFWIGSHRNHHQSHNLHNNYLPSTYASGLTSPPRQHSSTPPPHDAGAPGEAAPNPREAPANLGSFSILKWAVCATIAFIAVFFLGSEFYKYQKDAPNQIIGLVLVCFVLVLVIIVIAGCGRSFCCKRRPVEQPSQTPATDLVSV